MADDLVRYDRVDDIAIVTLNDPKTLNAASTAMVGELFVALDRAAAEARAVIVTGEGRGFCSGANLSGGNVDPQALGYDAGAPLDTHYNVLIRHIRALPLPVIAAVNGVAAGAGFPIALACDYIIAAETAYFLQPFLRIGLVPDCGSAYFLVRTVGRQRANAMMLLGDRLSASDAMAMGLLNEICDAEMLLLKAREIATRFAAGPQKATAMVKALGWAAMESNLEEMLGLERVLQFEAGQTANHREGIAAFLEKRPAVFLRDKEGA